MEFRLEKSWKRYLSQEFEQPYFNDLKEFVRKEYEQYQCYPAPQDIFTAFNCCAFDDVRVVILGQDPYHGSKQAHGLSFSVPDSTKHPPSLVNIFKELEQDMAVKYPESGNLERWANQGVLLLNATLTVRAQQAGSHQKKGWEPFTDAVIRKLSEERRGIVFLLWGGYAKKKGRLINAENHHILVSGHPSPLSANRGHWFGNKHFSQVNKLLHKENRLPVNW